MLIGIYTLEQKVLGTKTLEQKSLYLRCMYIPHSIQITSTKKALAPELVSKEVQPITGLIYK